MVMKSWNAQYNWIWVKVRNEILQFISAVQQGISHFLKSPNDSEQQAANNALQDFISDYHSKPAVVCFPRLHNHYKYGINGKGVKQAF